MAQAWTDTERKVLKQDPLHDVKEEIQHQGQHLRHVDLPGGKNGNGNEDTQMGDVVKAEVPAAFVDELKVDHVVTEPATDFEPTEADFMEDDPLHDVKQELEHHSPHLRHVESPYSPGHNPPTSPGGAGGEDLVKCEVPRAFEEELKDDHDIVTGHVEESNATAEGEGGENQAHQIVRDPTFIGLRRGAAPRFRISANVLGNRPRGSLNANPETANMCFKDKADDEEAHSSEPKPADSSNPGNEESTKSIGPRGISARGTPHFRISAHHGMRPGGPLSRDLKSETPHESTPVGGDGAGVDLSADMKPKGPGLPSTRGGQLGSSGPRRGGGLQRTGSGVPGGEQKGGSGGSLARTGSGVPGEQRLGGGLARTGSGVPGNSLARQGSGAFGGLARTGSGIPSSKGGNDLKDFSSFLDSGDFSKEEAQSPPATEEQSGDKKGVLGKIGGKIGETWNQVNSYGSPSQEVETPKDTEKVAPGEVLRSADATASTNLQEVERAAQ